jgi:hypothetical protein
VSTRKPYANPAFKIVDKASTDTSNRRRSQRVALQVALLLSVLTADGNRKQARALTQVVNAHGGLLESSLTVPVNQEIVLINLTTGKEARCRVVRTEQLSSEVAAMAFEFKQPTAQFWPISFPPEDWEEFAQ